MESIAWPSCEEKHVQNISDCFRSPSRVDLVWSNAWYCTAFATKKRIGLLTSLVPRFLLAQFALQTVRTSGFVWWRSQSEKKTTEPFSKGKVMLDLFNQISRCWRKSNCYFLLFALPSMQIQVVQDINFTSLTAVMVTQINAENQQKPRSFTLNSTWGQPMRRSQSPFTWKVCKLGPKMG